MLSDAPLELRSATIWDVRVPFAILLVLLVIAAALSTHPVLLTSVLFVLFVVGWGGLILGFYKVNLENLLLIIYSDGRVRVKSRNESASGVLIGQQWCVQPFAILRIGTKKMTQNLLVLSAQQKNTDDFRRLNMWLKQDFHKGVQQL
jgi:hypothetical protein